MPQLPEFNEGRSFTPQQPTGLDINPAAFGADSAAAAGAFSTLANIGTDLLEKRKRAEDASYANETAQQAKRDAEAFRIKDLTVNGWDGHAQRVQKFAADTFQAGQKQAPSEEAKTLFAHTAMEPLGRESQKAYDIETVSRADAHVKNIGVQTDKNIESITKNPDMKSAMMYLSLMRGSVRSQVDVSISKQTGDDTERSLGDKIAQGYFRAQLLQAKDPLNKAGSVATLVKGLSELKAEDEVSKDYGEHNSLTGQLNPEARDQLIAQYQTALKAQHEIRLADYHQWTRDILADRKGGQLAVNNAWLNEGRALVKAGLLTPAQFTHNVFAANMNMAHSEAVKAAKDTPLGKEFEVVDEMTKLAEAENAKAAKAGLAVAGMEEFGQSVKQEVQNSVAIIMQREQTARNQDFAAYAQGEENSYGIKGYYALADVRNIDDADKHGKDIKNLIVAQRAYHKFLNQPSDNWRLLSKPDSVAIANMLTDPKADELLTSKRIGKLKAGWGEFYDEFIGQMFDDSALKSRWKMAAIIPDEQDRAAMISSIKFSAHADENYYKTFPAETRQEFNTVLARKTNDFVQAIASTAEGGGREDLVKAVRDSISDLVMHKRTANLSLGREEAFDDAVRIYTNSFHVIKGPNGSALMVPKKVGSVDISESYVSGFIKSHHSADALKEMGVNPAVMLKENTEWRRERLISDIASTGKWVPVGGSSDFIALKFQDTQLPLVRWRPVLGPDGKPIVKSLRDISQNPDQRTLDEVKGSFGLFKDYVSGKASAAASAVSGAVDSAKKAIGGGKK